MIEGSLRNVPLTDVFQVVVTSQKSGALMLSRGRSNAAVHFDKGRIRYAQLAPDVNLAEILLRMELLDAQEALTLLERATSADPGLELGLAAVRAGFMNEEGLHAALERQVGEVLGELLSWRSGSFSFGEEDGTGHYPLNHDFDAMMLLMQVSERFGDSQSESVAPQVVFQRAGDPTRSEIPPNGWELLAAVDGRRNAASVAAEVDLPERYSYHLLQKLEAGGIIEPSPFKVEAPRVLVVTPSRSHGRVLRLLLLRNRALPQLEFSAQAAMTFLREQHARAVVIDDHNGSAWQMTRELRRLPGKTHLPVLVLGRAGSEAGGVLARMRRPKALSLEKPFTEMAFQELISRMVGSPAA